MTRIVVFIVVIVLEIVSLFILNALGQYNLWSFLVGYALGDIMQLVFMGEDIDDDE